MTLKMIRKPLRLKDRNRKKVLSLVLCVAVMLSVMVLGAGAAFSDQDQIENTEAVNMCSALNIIGGYEDGSFHPERNIKRSEITKMICVALNGGKEPNVSTNAVPTFSDVRGTSAAWAEGYIESCVAQGIVSGVGGGRFAPDGNVTAAQLAKMLLVALGYKSENEGFTGNAWETNVNVRAAQKGLYAGLESMDTSAAVTRDQAAQMVWNALNAYEVEYKTTIITDENGQLQTQITVQDKVDATFGRITLLQDKYEAKTFTGTFNGNSDNLNLKDGQIQVYGSVSSSIVDSSANFTYDFDLSYIGEEVKVLFKDGVGGTTNVPDDKDDIYGVVVTGNTTVYNITKNDIQDVDGTADKIKFGDVKYDYVDGTANGIVTNYHTTAALNDSNLNSLMVQSGDTIKFVCNDSGKIVGAYVIESSMAKVTSVTDETVTLSTLGTINFEGNDVYDGIAKDDVVVYTRLYDNGSDLDDATFVVTKAEVVTGEITAYNTAVSGEWSVTIDGTEYKIDATGLVTSNTLVSDAVALPDADEIGTTVDAYLINGMVKTLDRVSDTELYYALVLDDNDVDTAGVSVGKVQLLLANGDEVIYEVDKDSEQQALSDLSEGDLVKYSLTGGTLLDIKDANNYRATNSKVNIATNGYIWNDETKVVAGVGVADTDCVLFVKINATDYKAYNIRDLRDITAPVGGKDVWYATNSAGRVVAAYVDLGARPSSASVSTLYGIVTAYKGVTKIGTDDYRTFSIWTGDASGEDTIVYIKDGTQTTLTKGALYSFDQSSDNCYLAADFTQLTANGTTVKDVAVKEYDESDNTLSFYNGVTDKGAYYEGSGLATLALHEDCKVVYVNADDVKAGANTGIVEFDSGTGYANAKIVVEDGLIVGIIVETSRKVNVNGTTDVAAAYVAPTGTASTDRTAIDAALLANGSAVVSGDVTLDGTALTNLTAGRTLIVNGDLTLGIAQSFAGNLIVNGDLNGDYGITVTGEGSLSVTGNVVSSTAGLTVTGTGATQTASVNIDGALAKLANVTYGDVTIGGAVTTVADITSGTVTFNGAVTTVNDISGGDVTFNSTVGTVDDITGGNVTFNGAITTFTKLSAGTVNLNSTMTINNSTTLTAGTVNIGTNGVLTLDNSSAAITGVNNLTLNGENGAKIAVTSTNATTVDADNKLYDGQATPAAVTSLAAAANYIWKTVNNVTGFILTP